MRGSRVLTLALVLVALVTLGCALGVLARWTMVGPVDAPLTRFVVDNRAEGLTSVMKAATTLGASVFLLAVALAAGFTFRARERSSAPLLTLIVGWCGGQVIFTVVKVVLDRQRPPLAQAVHHFGGLAFPSGHATQSMVVYGMIAALVTLTVNARSSRIVAWAVAALLVVIVGFTRVYLGAHWASDVVGGWILGGLWLAACVLVLREGVRAQPGP